jgi:hypothetical protein
MSKTKVCYGEREGGGVNVIAPFAPLDPPLVNGKGNAGIYATTDYSTKTISMEQMKYV